MEFDSARWIEQLPVELSRQAQVLRQLLADAQADSRVRVLAVGCSIGRGVADEHSDIDSYLAVSPEVWPAYLEDVPGMLARLGSVVDQSHKFVTPAEGDPYRLSWALYGDGVQLELAIGKAPTEIHPGHDWVVLHDPDRRVADPRPMRLATQEQVHEWGYEGWSALLLCAKYLSRRSLWEALETLHFARTRVWRLWAAARRIPDPQYGLTAVLDHTDPSAPPGIEATQAPLQEAALKRAALACADLLNELWSKATAAVTGSPKPLPPAAAAAQQRLAALLPIEGRQSLIVLNGPIASGKNAVSTALAGSLQRDGRKAAVIDLDEVWVMLDHQVPRDQKIEHWLEARRAAAMLTDEFYRSGRDYVIINGPFFTNEERTAYLKHLNTAVVPMFCTLRVSFEEAWRRSQADPRRVSSKDRDWLAARHSASDALMPALRVSDLVVDTDGRTPAEIADYVAAHLVPHGGYIRRAAASDAPTIQAVLNAAYGPLGARGLNFTAATQDEELTRHQIQTREVYAIDLGSQIVGTVTLRDRIDVDGLRHIYINGLAVRPDLQGRGLGRALLRFAEAIAVWRGITVVRLDTAKPATDLVALYTRHGYRAMADRHWAGKKYDSVIMQKLLRDRS